MYHLDKKTLTLIKAGVIATFFTTIIYLISPKYDYKNKKEKDDDEEEDYDDFKKHYPDAFQRGILASGTVFASSAHKAGLGWIL